MSLSALEIIAARAVAPPKAGVLIPGRDRAVSLAERELGQELMALLRGSAEIAARFDFLLGRALGGTGRAVCVVDAELAQARAVPWELLALPGEEPLEASGIPVVRLLQGPPVGPALTREGVRLWSPTPDEAVCAARLEDLGRQIGGDAEAPAWVHVVCHGRLDALGLGLAGADGDLAPGTATHVLGEAVRGARGVVLEVCDAAAGPREADSLASSMLRAGARACVAPRTRLAATAAQAFAGAFHTDGALLERLVAGRAAVRALAHPRPDARWHVLALHVASLSALQDAESESQVGGALGVFADATALAVRSGLGFVGMEHVLVATAAAALAEDEGHATRVGRSLVRPRAAGLLEQAGRLTPRAEASTPSDAPALVSLRSLLPQDATVDDLWAALLADAAGLYGLLGLPAPAGSPFDEGSATFEVGIGGPARGLRVLSGPEAGRFLRLSPGDTLGRASSSARATVRLYAGSPADDAFLSREALRWRGGGAVELYREAELVRGGTPRRVKGLVELLGGDVLVLGSATRLLAVDR